MMMIMLTVTIKTIMIVVVFSVGRLSQVLDEASLGHFHVKYSYCCLLTSFTMSDTTPQEIGFQSRHVFLLIQCYQSQCLHTICHLNCIIFQSLKTLFFIFIASSSTLCTRGDRLSLSLDDYVFFSLFHSKKIDLIFFYLLLCLPFFHSFFICYYIINYFGYSNKILTHFIRTSKTPFQRVHLSDLFQEDDFVNEAV